MGGRKTPRSGEQVRTAQYLSRDQIEVCFGLCCAAPQPEVDSIGVSQVSPADGGFERLSAPSQMASGPSGQLSWSQDAGVLVEPWASASTTPQLHRRHRQQSSTASPSSTTLDYELASACPAAQASIFRKTGLDSNQLGDSIRTPMQCFTQEWASLGSLQADVESHQRCHQPNGHIGPTKGGFGTAAPQPHRRFHSGPRNTSGIPGGPIMPKDCWGVTLLEASDLQIRTQRPVSGIVGSAHGPNSFLFNASPWYSAVSIGLRVGNSDSVYREEPSTWSEIDLTFGPHRAVTEADPQSLGLPLETLSVAYEEQLRSDNGSEFKNKKLRRILAHLNIRYRYTPAYSPEYGQVATAFSSLRTAFLEGTGVCDSQNMQYGPGTNFVPTCGHLHQVHTRQDFLEAVRNGVWIHLF